MVSQIGIVPMKAVILAAGDGVRMKPLTNTRPKVMLQVAGKPILYHLLLEVKKAGIKDVVIVVRYLKEQIIEYFKKEDLGLKITFVEQGTKNGTGEAILTAEKFIDDTFVVLAGITKPKEVKSASFVSEAKDLPDVPSLTSPSYR